MSVKFKLMLGFGFMLALLIAQGLVSYNLIHSQSASMEEVVQEDAAFERLSKDIAISMLMHRRLEKNIILYRDDAKRLEGSTKQLEQESEQIIAMIKQLDQAVQDDPHLGQEVQAAAKGIAEHYDRYRDMLGKAVDTIRADTAMPLQQANELLAPCVVEARAMEALLGQVAQAGHDMMQASVGKAESLAAEAARTLTAFGVGGAIAALVLALFIILSISRPLLHLAKCADMMGKGDFSVTIRSDIKGGFGKLARSLESIRTAVSDTMAEITDMDEAVLGGRILKRCDTEQFDGAFRSLVENINSLADTLTWYLDAIPAPVMIIDKDYAVQYMNKAGAAVGGTTPDTLPGRPCYDFFRTEDCNTERCACRRAMGANAPADSETTARPGSNELEIAYSANPIVNKDGIVVGALEIVTDQTAIKRAQAKMAELASSAGVIAQRVAASSEELSAQIEQAGNGAELQRARMTETASAMEEMNATVLEVARNAGQAADSTGQAKEHASSGAEVVERAVQAINRVNTITETLKQNMALLDDQAESIGGVMNVISDIADQTNLLALNAAIEAARAGEAGKGFAVVADEVRKLAEKTMAATKEVGDKIRAIQEAAAKNLESTEHAATAVQEATGLAGESGEALADIVSLSEANAGMVQSIATAAEEQSATSEHISRAIEEVHVVVSDTADGMQRSTQAVLELSEQIVGLNDLIEALNGTSQAA